jgi:hypothetical protein
MRIELSSLNHNHTTDLLVWRPRDCNKAAQSGRKLIVGTIGSDEAGGGEPRPKEKLKAKNRYSEFWHYCRQIRKKPCSELSSGMYCCVK